MIHNRHVSASAKANDAKKVVLLATLWQLIHVDQVHLSPTSSSCHFIGFSWSSDVKSWFKQQGHWTRVCVSPKNKKHAK